MSDPSDDKPEQQVSGQDIEHVQGLMAPQFGLNHEKGHRARVFVMDSTPIIQIRQAHRRMQDMAKTDPGFKAPFDPYELLSHVSEPGKNTLVLTHTVLKELLRNDTDETKTHIGLRKKPGEAPNLHHSKHTFRIPSTRIFMEFLNDARDNTRYYDSIESMLKAGEFDRAKGGIVIVDDEKLPGHHPLNEDGQYPIITNQRGRAIKHLGEQSIIKMAEMISDFYSPGNGRTNGVGYAIIGIDKDLKREINNLGLSHPGERVPKSFNMKVFIDASCRAGVVDPSKRLEMLEWLTRKHDQIRYPKIPGSDNRDFKQPARALTNEILNEELDGMHHNRVDSMMKYFTFPSISAPSR